MRGMMWMPAMLASASAAMIDARHLDHRTPLPPEEHLVAFAARSLSTSSNHTLIIPLPPASPPASPPSPTPSPLDTSISYALSDNCLRYLGGLLSSTTFQACLPFSLLLTTSSSYGSLVSAASSSGNYTTLNSLIAYTANPAPSSAVCDAYMLSALSQIQEKSNCQADIGGSGVVAKEAEVGLATYQMMREAESLTDAKTGAYCYLEALSNSNPDDLYLWSVPAGIELPASSKPTCSSCSASLLSLYATYTTSDSAFNSTLISSTIGTVNSVCGNSFITLSAASTSKSAAARLEPHAALLSAVGLLLLALCYCDWRAELHGR